MSEGKKFDLDRMFELKSAIQKCIRRGMEKEATMFASELEVFSDKGPEMLWDRLRIIVSEDCAPENVGLENEIECLHKKYWEYFAKKSFACVLFSQKAVVLLCRAKKSRDVDDLITINEIEMNLLGKKLEIPDFALDNHTKRGKIMGRDWKFFFSEGVKLENRAEGSGKYLDQARELIVKHGSGSPSKDVKLARIWEAWKTRQEKGGKAQSSLTDFYSN